MVQAAAVFGFSRLSVYHAQRAFEQHGLSGLVARKRRSQEGPQIDTGRDGGNPGGGWPRSRSCPRETLAERLAQRLRVSLHPRSIERTLARRPQKGGQPASGPAGRGPRAALRATAGRRLGCFAIVGMELGPVPTRWHVGVVPGRWRTAPGGAYPVLRHAATAVEYGRGPAHPGASRHGTGGPAGG
ncbi:MAG: hypothetical protein MZV64_71570 [Ignavibacteriales bacterium]|nr:hypothetical protein [Ignavibacteriales bacterium]